MKLDVRDYISVEEAVQKPEKDWCCAVHRYMELQTIAAAVPWAALIRVQLGGDVDHWADWARRYTNLVDSQLIYLSRQLGGQLSDLLAPTSTEHVN